MKIGGRGPPVPDAELIRALAALLTETGLTEIEYAVGDRPIAASPCAICTQMVLRARRGREGPDGHRWGAPPNRFALDSPLEEAGLKLLVPSPSLVPIALSKMTGNPCGSCLGTSTGRLFRRWEIR
jgi:hypothetical protein